MLITGESKFIENFVELERMGHIFYLTGSRFFGDSSSESDWDFMVKENAEEALLSFGYTVITNPDYEDGTSTLVMQKDNFHIQLYDVETLELMLKLRDSIKSNPYFYHLYAKMGKADRKLFWKGLLTLKKKYNNG